MRKEFEVQYELGATPIEKIELPLDSRDELPPVLRALQYIYSTPKLRKKVFSLLKSKIMSGLKQRATWYESMGDFSVCNHQTRFR